MSFNISKVLILDGVDADCGKMLQKNNIQVTTINAKLQRNDLIKELNAHDAVIVRSATKLTADILSECNSLRVIGRAGTGVDNIDVTAATNKGILVMNTPGGNTLSAAEHTCALICSLSRAIPEACASLKTCAWDRKKFLGNELYGKVLAIVGLGRIGREVCDRMKSFGMRIIGFDPLVSADTAASWGIELFPLEELWPIADYITVHVPLLSQTRYLINEKVLKICKSTAKIVNVARGGIVEEAALLKALENGIVAGAALDVFENEPPKDFALLQHPKVICTPHLGANTQEAQKRVAMEIAEQFIGMCAGEALCGVVNAPALAEASTPIAKPWINLANALGAVASKLLKVEEGARITVDLFGNLDNKLSKVIVPAVLKGYFSSDKSCKVNLVNASSLAKEKNIEIDVKTQPKSPNCLRSMSIGVQNKASKISLYGKIDDQCGALLGMDNCTFSCGVALQKNLLFFKNSGENEFVSIAEALRNTSLLALVRSQKSCSECWTVACTDKPVLNIKKASFVDQIDLN